MEPAITISSYSMPAFVRLNIRACRALWPKAPILISDDKSDHSEAIEEIASEEGTSFVGSSSRMSHCTGDLQGLINALAFGQAHGRIALKVSQRLVPASIEFREAFEEVMKDPEVWFATPGQLAVNTISRPSSRFFVKFSKLTDVIAARPEHIDRVLLVDHYKAAVSCPATIHQQLVEVAVDQFVTRNIEPHRRLVEAWTNPTLGKPKCLLRRSQCSSGEYSKLAKQLGCPEGDNFPLAEWREMERKQYKCLADVV